MLSFRPTRSILIAAVTISFAALSAAQGFAADAKEPVSDKAAEVKARQVVVEARQEQPAKAAVAEEKTEDAKAETTAAVAEAPAAAPENAEAPATPEKAEAPAPEAEDKAVDTPVEKAPAKKVVKTTKPVEIVEYDGQYYYVTDSQAYSDYSGSAGYGNAYGSNADCQ